MEKIRMLFLCGEQSPWGYAHLESILCEPRFEVVAIALATQNRWAIFRKALSGGEQVKPSWKGKVKRLITKILKPKISNNTQEVVKRAKQQEIPVIFCNDANQAKEITTFQNFNPDLLFSAAYPQIFKAELLSAFPRGAFNSHPSLLPRCRGAHPVFWAIASGESKTGSTIHIMTPALDQGDVVAQIEVDLLSSDTRSQLYAKLNATIPQLISEFADYLIDPESESRPQNNAEATYFRNDRVIHRRIFWSEMGASQIYNLVRACDGSAYFWHNDQRILVKHVMSFTSNRNMTNQITVPKGTIVDLKDGKPIIAVRKGFVMLAEIQAPILKPPSFQVGMMLI